jgi:acyl CoA:acetate/3-ketoacid CoA transferase alpha subunit
VVELVHIGEKDYLLYKSMPIDVCFVQGVLADESGNISLKGEANITEQLELAAAAHNSGGIVVVEVEKLVQAGTIPPTRWPSTASWWTMWWWAIRPIPASAWPTRATGPRVRRTEDPSQ